MATYTDSLGFNKNSAAFPAYGLNAVTKVEMVLDFAKIAAARVAAGATALAAADVLEVIPLAAGTLVLEAGYEVTTAEGATCTIMIGDGTDPDGWVAAANLNTLASAASTGAYTNTTVYYAATDTIDITLGHDATDAAVVRIWAVIVDCNLAS
jgi:hypothetical protein